MARQRLDGTKRRGLIYGTVLPDNLLMPSKVSVELIISALHRIGYSWPLRFTSPASSASVTLFSFRV